MENFVELTQYKMLNELSRNPRARILVIHKNENGVLSEGQSEKIQEVMKKYPNLVDEDCVDEFLKNNK